MRDLLTERLASPPAVERSADEALSGRRSTDLTALSARIERLNLSMEAARLKLDAQRRRLDAIRNGLEDLGGGLSALHNGADAMTRELTPAPAPVQTQRPVPQISPVPKAVQPPQPVAAPVKAAPAVVVPVKAAISRPIISLPAVEEEERLRSRPDVVFYPDSGPSIWTRPMTYAPYAAIAALGLTLSCTGPLHKLSRLPSLRLTQTPVEAPVEPPTQTAELSPAQPLEPVDDASHDEVLKLVYSYRPEGAKTTVREILSPEIESSAETQSAWIVEPAEAGRFLVSFRPYGDSLETAPVYEFEVDLRAKSVSASPATEAALRGGALAVN